MKFFLYIFLVFINSTNCKSLKDNRYKTKIKLKKETTDPNNSGSELPNRISNLLPNSKKKETNFLDDLDDINLLSDYNNIQNKENKSNFRHPISKNKKQIENFTYENKLQSQNSLNFKRNKSCEQNFLQKSINNNFKKEKKILKEKKINKITDKKIPTPQPVQNKERYQKKIINLMYIYIKKQNYNFGPIQNLTFKLFNFIFNEKDIERLSDRNAEILYNILKCVIDHINSDMPVNGILPGSLTNISNLAYNSINYKKKYQEKIDRDLLRLSKTFSKDNINSGKATTFKNPIEKSLDTAIEIYDKIKIQTSNIDINFKANEFIINTLATFAQKGTDGLYTIAIWQNFNFSAPDSPLIYKIKINIVKSNKIIKKLLKNLKDQKIKLDHSPLFNLGVILSRFIDEDPEFQKLEKEIDKVIKSKKNKEKRDKKLHKIRNIIPNSITKARRKIKQINKKKNISLLVSNSDKIPSSNIIR